MLKQGTVLVVGAGASVDFELPLGEGLKACIASALQFDRGNGDDKIRYAVVNLAGNARINEFFARCRLISHGVGHAASIDDFIENHRGDEALASAAKLAIAKCILDAERGSKLHFDQRRETFDPSRVTKTWISAFFRLLNQGVPKSEIENLFQNVSIVCFNYDRCIEQFLAVAIAGNYGASSEYAGHIVQEKLHIFRPYGSLGPLFGEPTRRVEFGASMLPSTQDVLRNLKTYSEQVEDQEGLAKIRETIRSAHTLVFLGNAYHENNMKLLFPEGAIPITKRIFATRLGINSDDDLGVVNRYFLKFNISPDPEQTIRRFHRFSSTCVSLFDDYRLSLRL